MHLFNIEQWIGLIIFLQNPKIILPTNKMKPLRKTLQLLLTENSDCAYLL